MRAYLGWGGIFGAAGIAAALTLGGATGVSAAPVTGSAPAVMRGVPAMTTDVQYRYRGVYRGGRYYGRGYGRGNYGGAAIAAAAAGIIGLAASQALAPRYYYYGVPGPYHAPRAYYAPRYYYGGPYYRSYYGDPRW